jgi:hypothetical protein
MINKKTLIVLLALVNVLLLGTLILSTQPPTSAFAQETMPALPAQGEDYLVIAAEGELHNDVIYVLDARNDFLHAFRTPFPRVAGVPTRLSLRDTHDLQREFRREAPR